MLEELDWWFKRFSVRVWIDPIKLAANNLTIQEVENALRNENVSLPAGTLKQII
jgi:HAE1 family hydrophobic/amphiphilic exporter-1/multidrug efflux pump